MSDARRGVGFCVVVVSPGPHRHLDPGIASFSVAPEEPAALLIGELRGEVRPQCSGFLREPA